MYITYSINGANYEFAATPWQQMRSYDIVSFVDSIRKQFAEHFASEFLSEFSSVIGPTLK